jgi:hypothetical protein
VTDEKKWVEVENVGQDEEAEILCGFLRSEGIETVVESRKFHMEPVNFGDLTGIRILVPEKDSVHARALIERRRRDFERMKRRGENDSILTESGPADAPDSE